MVAHASVGINPAPYRALLAAEVLSALWALATPPRLDREGGGKYANRPKRESAILGNRQEVENARYWIFEDTKGDYLSLEGICGVLGISVEAVRRRATILERVRLDIERAIMRSEIDDAEARRRMYAVRKRYLPVDAAKGLGRVKFSRRTKSSGARIEGDYASA